MITQEVIAFIKSQTALGKTHDEISKMLQDNGWKPEDVAEAFAQAMPAVSVQSVMPAEPVPIQPIFKPMQRVEPVAQPMQPMQRVEPVAQPMQPMQPAASKSSKTLPVILGILLVAVIAIAGYIIWMLNAQKNAAVASLVAMQAAQVQQVADQNQTASDSAPQLAASTPKDCGTSDGSLDYTKDPMLACLGAAALACQPATGTIKYPAGNITPGIFSIVTEGSNCSFQLQEASGVTNPKTKADISGQSVSCPLASVMFSDNPEAAKPVFRSPDTDSAAKYAAEIYNYGTSGLFIQNSFTKSKIAAAGCNGDFIDTFLAMHQKNSAK